MRVHDTHARRRTRQPFAQIHQRLLNTVPHILAAHRRAVSARILEREEPPAVDERLNAQRGVLADFGHRKEERGAARCVDIAPDGIGTVVRAEARDAEATDAGGAAELEAVVDVGGLWGGGCAEGEGVDEAAAKAGCEGDACVAKGEGEL